MYEEAEGQERRARGLIVNTPCASRRLSFRHDMMDRFTHGLHTSSVHLVARIRPDR